jgi:hypothetical protein
MDDLQANADLIAGKIGIGADQVKAISGSLQSKLADGTDQIAALEQVAQQHGVSVDKIQELLGHAGAPSDLANQAEGFVKGLFKS